MFTEATDMLQMLEMSRLLEWRVVESEGVELRLPFHRASEAVIHKGNRPMLASPSRDQSIAYEEADQERGACSQPCV